jgi:lipoic acid synthetase
MRKPEWLRIKKTGIYDSNLAIEKLIRDHNLHTVCESAQCPNKGECFSKRTATFMILGDICTRSCTFCAVKKEKKPLGHPDPEEPQHIAEAVSKLGLAYIVITMVTRDDLPDGGSAHLVKVMNRIRETAGEGSEPAIEVLVSDMQGDLSCIEKILAAQPAVFNHNIETVPRLYPLVRPEADYQRSLKILSHTGRYAPQIPVKSGFMVGLGETEEEIVSLLDDLRVQGVEILTIGQYLAPSAGHYPVFAYIEPKIFEHYRRIALDKGFKTCFSGPFVRSSYNAQEAFSEQKKQQNKNSGGELCSETDNLTSNSFSQKENSTEKREKSIFSKS